MADVFVKWSGQRDHPPDVAQWQVTKAIVTMRKRAREEPLAPVQQIYNAEAAKLTPSSLPFSETWSLLSKASAFAESAYRTGNYCARRILYEDVGWQMFSSQENSRIIGFATEYNIRLLCESTDV